VKGSRINAADSGMIDLMRRFAVLGLAALVLAAGCREDQTPQELVAAKGIVCREAVVSPGSATLHVGDTLRASATRNGCSTAQGILQFLWLPQDTSVVRVDSLSGVIQARKHGITVVVATEVSNPSVRAAMVAQVIP
jgi:hypothetical protein